MKPLAIDLFCGLGGWTEGLLAEGYHVVGFDIEAHDYGDGKRYPSQLVIQDVLTIRGKQFKDAALIVASPPCQEFSYMAMPWSRAKAIAAEYRSGKRDVKQLTALFDACFRIQREAIEAAGHYIPMVVENVRGAQPWVGKAKWNFGSYYLFGDVPALMPITMPHRNPVHELAATGFKTQGMKWSDRSKTGQDFTRIAGRQAEGIKHGGDCFNDPSWAGKQGGTKTVRRISEAHRSKSPAKGYGTVSEDGLKQGGISGVRENGKGDSWFQDGVAAHPSKSKSRKAASAAIAKIPFALAAWIAKVYYPKLIDAPPV